MVDLESRVTALKAAVAGLEAVSCNGGVALPVMQMQVAGMTQ